MTAASRSSAPHLPPGPKGKPVVGTVFSALDDPLALFMATTQEYGDVAAFRFLQQRYVLVTDPDAIRHVLVENPKAYAKSKNYVGLKVLLGEGLLTSEGDTWKKQRRLAQPAFHRDKLASFVSSMVSCTADMLDRWQDKTSEPFDAHTEMMRLTFRIVGRTLLSKELEGEAKQIGVALNEGLKWANEHVQSLVRIPPSWPTPKNRRMHDAKKTFDDLVFRLIEEREKEGPKEDLLSMLMDARDEDGGRMSKQNLRDELLTIVIAGHETTANALSFAIFLLSQHPAVFRKLAAEVAEVLGDRPPTLADVPKLRYATMVIEEAMRLYPPAWVFEREATVDDVVGGFDIPAGTIVGISPYALHRSPKLWENPCGFDPERFSPEQKDKRHKYAYLPFGGGPRTCIGNAFATMEMTIVLAMIAQRVRLDLVPGKEIELDPSVTLRPKSGVWVRLARPKPMAKTAPALHVAQAST